MIVNLEISAIKEPLPVLLQRVILLYTVDACREAYTQLKLHNMADEGPERFCETAIRGQAFTEEERNTVMNCFLTSLQLQSRVNIDEG